ncbi:tetraspanin-1-like [Bicyclus anynana]|uniref:Tetraspanin-1-like n=1 Tax=Bicyclus anynana TaxID=110368 RepID=A0A6J1MUG5_BICAN|nr:tetraspanin-1-like [Bicyclus anynana]
MHTIGLPRTCLGFTNLLFFITGFIGCVICIWCIVNTEFFREVNYTVTKSSLVATIANFVNLKLWVTPVTTILIPIAIITMLSSCCGILGAGCKMKCAIKSYIFLTTVLLTTAFWLFFISGVYNIYTNNQNTLRYMKSTISSNYGKENDLITYVWDYIMVNYECCGAVDYKDFIDTKWHRSNLDKLYPIQCCKLKNQTGLVPISDDCTKSTEPEAQSNTNVSCFNSLRTSIGDNKGKIIFYMIFFGLAYSVLVLFAYCIIRGEPLITAITGNPRGLLLKRQEQTNREIPSGTSLDNMMFMEEPPQRVVRVVSAINPFQTYKFTPNVHDTRSNTYSYDMRSDFK